MGLASSQARLLNLTARMHQIEYGAARLEAMKLQMANESKQVYNDYLEALEKTKVQVKTLNTDGSVTYVDVYDYDTGFLGAGYAIDFNGVVYDNSTAYPLVSSPTTYAEAFEVAEEDLVDGKHPKYPEITSTGTYYISAANGELLEEDLVDTSEEVELTFEQLCKDAFGATTAPTGKEVETVITNLINSGMVTIVQGEKQSDGSWLFRHQPDFEFPDWESSVATNTGLQEVTDEIFLKKAEAKYEADMKRIDMKDRKYDHDLAALEAERNAIKQEMETLKTVAKDNVERTFKLFS